MEERGLDLWERQQGESTPSFDAFTVYREMGKERSLAKVARYLGKSGALIDRWSSRDRWVERVLAYDAHMERIALDVKDKNIQEMLERHTKVSMIFQNKVIEGLRGLNSSTLTPSDLIRIFETSVRVERALLIVTPEAFAAAGVDTSIVFNFKEFESTSFNFISILSEPTL